MVTRNSSLTPRKLILLVLCLANPIFARSPCAHDANNFRCVRYVNNHDGDTITFNIAGVHQLLGKEIRVRLAGIDAPEVATRDRCEKEKGLAAKQMVAALLRPARRIDLANVKRGKYFRIVADVRFDGRSLTAALLRHGLGYPYHGGKKKKHNWCN